MRNLQISSRKLYLRENELMLGTVGRATFEFFRKRQNPDTGLIFDRGPNPAPATIAGVGFGLTIYPIAVYRQWIKRADAVAYTLKVLRVLAQGKQGQDKAGCSGYKGFFYHFLDPKTGLRAMAPEFWDSELSSIDTALLMAGVRFAATYYDQQTADEQEIRMLCQRLYDGVEWTWLLHEEGTIGHGWTPEQGMIPNVYGGFSEALLLYLLALGSNTHPIPATSWGVLLANPVIEKGYGKQYVSMPGTPLFCYQYPHCWVDFRGIRDDLNRRMRIDWFENSRRATLAQHRYACLNPEGFRGYDALNWGLTASDGPGPRHDVIYEAVSKAFYQAPHLRPVHRIVTKIIDGKERTFRFYSERGAPHGFDDGTIAPTAAISSLPFAPELALPTMRHWLLTRPELFSDEGFTDAFNPTFDPDKPSGWVDPERVAIDQGPEGIMIENYRSGFPWEIMRRDPVLRQALIRAGFRGGWLDR
jgi:hypothetical protein